MIPEDQVRFIIGILACIPAGIAVRFVRANPTKKYLSIILSILIQFYVYRQQIFLALFLHVVVYLLILYKGRKCGFFVTAISLVGMLAYHIKSLIMDYGGWKIDLSMILMLYVAKYSLFAYAYEDGGADQSKLKHKYQKEERIIALPSFIDYFSYLQFAPTCVLNTPVDYSKYDKYMNYSGSFATIPVEECIIKSLKDLGIAVACLIIYAGEMFLVPMMVMREPEFANNNPFYIFIYSSACIWMLKFKYYFGWKLSMLSVHASGISYQPTDQKDGDNFLGVQTCNPWTIQSSIHLREKVNNWNITVQQWLRKCVYDRLGHSKQIGQLQTFLVSAFWHGAYGGYYLSFLFWFIQLYISGIIYKFSSYKKNPVYKMYSAYKPYSYWLIWLVWNVIFSNNGLYFHVLSAKTGLTILGSMYYTPVIFMVLTGLFFTFVPKKSSEKETQQKKE